MAQKKLSELNPNHLAKEVDFVSGTPVANMIIDHGPRRWDDLITQVGQDAHSFMGTNKSLKANDFTMAAQIERQLSSCLETSGKRPSTIVLSPLEIETLMAEEETFNQRAWVVNLELYCYASPWGVIKIIPSNTRRGQAMLVEQGVIG